MDHRVDLFRHFIETRYNNILGLPLDVMIQIESTVAQPPTFEAVKTAMRRLRLNRYFEYMRPISNHLMGLPPDISVPDEIKNELFRRFQRTSVAYREALPTRSFFNFTFVLTKLLNDMRPFRDDARLLAQLSRDQTKNFAKREMMEELWYEMDTFRIRPRTPPLHDEIARLCAS